MNDNLFVTPDVNSQKFFTQTKMRKPLLLVLPAPPLPLNQGYRHAAYNDIIQLSRLRDLHILICNGREWVYDFHTDSYELNHKKLSNIPGVKSVSFIELNVDWKKTIWQRFRHQVSVLLKRGRLMEDSSTDELTQRITELCQMYEISDIHFGITINLFIDAFANLRKMGNYRMSFTAHDIDADKVLVRMRENLTEKKFIKVLTNWVTYWIFLWKEIRTCRMSRFVISMAYRDFERLALKKVNVFFIPPYLHAVESKHSQKQLPQNPSLVVLGHLAFSAAGPGIDLFMEKVVTKIKDTAPGTIIRIIGKDASPIVISKCAQLCVFYQEYVEDPEELWNETTVVASPLLVSKGIRIRILEAAYRGIPVVCTAHSATGFYQPKEFLRVTNDFDLFADYCIELLTNNKIYQWEQQRIHDYFKLNLSEDTISSRWERVWSDDSPDFSLVPSSPDWKEMIIEPAR